MQTHRRTLETKYTSNSSGGVGIFSLYGTHTNFLLSTGPTNENLFAPIDLKRPIPVFLSPSKLCTASSSFTFRHLSLSRIFSGTVASIPSRNDLSNIKIMIYLFLIHYKFDSLRFLLVSCDAIWKF